MINSHFSSFLGDYVRRPRLGSSFGFINYLKNLFNFELGCPK